MTEVNNSGAPNGTPQNRESVIENNNVDNGEMRLEDSYASDDSSDAKEQITEADIPYLSDEAINAALENEPQEQVEDSGEDDQSSNDDSKADVGEDDNKDASDSKADEGRESAEIGKADEDPRVKQLEKQSQVIRDQQDYIQDTNRRYGEIKKLVNNEIAQLKEKMQDLSGVELVEAGKDLSKLEDRFDKITQGERLFNHIAKTQEVVMKTIPEADWDMDGMCAELEAAGGDKKYIADFRENPYAVANAHEIIMLHRAARNMKMARFFAAKYKEQAAAAPQKKQVSAKEVVNRIEKVARTSSGVTAKNGGTTTRKQALVDMTDKEIASLDDAELDRMIAESKRVA